MLHPLPRSLDPLQDESLTGFVLRLSHRLRISPSYLAFLAGLATASHRRPPKVLPVKLVIDLEEHLQPFATTTRLTLGEAADLCVGRLGIFNTEQSGPPRVVPKPTPLARLSFHHRWLFHSEPRYCPQCLAGDGSPLQNEHGGPWRRQWYLPMIFACLTHQRLLRHACPAGKDHEIHAAPMERSAVGVLSDPRPHPTQCRHLTGQAPPRGGRRVFCGAQLADPSPDHHAADDVLELLQLQNGLIADMNRTPEDPLRVAGIPLMNHQYFTDLGIIAALVLLSWPASEGLCASPALAAAIDEEARRRLRMSQTREVHHHQNQFRVSQPWAAAPADAYTSAAILNIAWKVIREPTLDDLRLTLAPLLTQADQINRRATNAIRSNPRRSQALEAVMRKPWGVLRRKPRRPPAMDSGWREISLRDRRDSQV